MEGRPERWFVGIGVGDYDDPELKLERALGDVGKMSDWFAARSGVVHRAAQPELAQNPRWYQITPALSDFFTTRQQNDVVIVYIACHGETEAGASYLFGRDTPRMNLVGRAVPASELGRILGSSPAQNVLVIVDACVAGVVAAAIADAAYVAVLDRHRQDPRRKYAQVLISSTYGLEPALDGAFVDAFLAVISDERWTGQARPWIAIDQLIAGLNAELDARGTGQIADCRIWSNGEVALVPNPNAKKGGLFSDAEFAAHFDPASRGVSSSETGEFFSGRTDELRRIARWLKDGPKAAPMFVVTGSGGTGKSALVGRVAVLSAPGLSSVEHTEAADGTVPAQGAIQRVFWCHGKTRDNLLAEFASFLGGTAASTKALLALAQRNGADKVVVVDALDEATGQEALSIAETLLKPLARESGLRLLIATRREAASGDDLIAALDPAELELLDLDDAPERLADMRRYVGSRLRALKLSADMPELAREATMDRLAQAIAQKADRSFLVASIAARSITSLERLPSDDSLPAEVGAALGAYLDRFDNAETIRDVLRPLAWSRGAGQPWGIVWRPLAEALASGRKVHEHDIATALRKASDLVVEAEDEGEPVYRLHEALAEHLRATTPDRVQAPARIARTLLELTERRSWAKVPRYASRHLPDFLIAADLPEEVARVMLDPARDRQDRSDGPAARDRTHTIEGAARLLAHHGRWSDLAPLCHQFSRSTGQTLPPLIEVLALGGQQQRAEALAANLTDVVDRMLAYRGLATIIGAEGDLVTAARCAAEVERTLPAMPADHLPMAWAWAAEAHAATGNREAAAGAALQAVEAAGENDDWDKMNGLFWSARAAKLAEDTALTAQLAAEIVALKAPPVRNQVLQAASVAGCLDLLNRLLDERLKGGSGAYSTIRYGNLGLAVADAGMTSAFDRLALHVGDIIPGEEADSLKRWAWAHAISGRSWRAIEIVRAIGEPIERSKAIARIAPLIAGSNSPDRDRLCAELKSEIATWNWPDEPRTDARLIRALWDLGAKEEALAAVEKRISSSRAASPLVDERAEEMRSAPLKHEGRKTRRRAMISSRAPVQDETLHYEAVAAAEKKDIDRARSLAARIGVPEYRARALSAIAQSVPHLETSLRDWGEALIEARRAGRGVVEFVLTIGRNLIHNSGDTAAADALEAKVARIDAEWQMEAFIGEYGAIRQTMPPGRERTRTMSVLMLAPVGLARNGTFISTDVRAAWERDEDGSRLFTLGLMQGDPYLLEPDIVAEAIRNSRSAFEQYHALKAVLSLPEERQITAQIVDAIEMELSGRPRDNGQRAWLEAGSERRQMGKLILQKIASGSSQSKL
jgi:hypothetical protein